MGAAMTIQALPSAHKKVTTAVPAVVSFSNLFWKATRTIILLPSAEFVEINFTDTLALLLANPVNL